MSCHVPLLSVCRSAWPFINHAIVCNRSHVLTSHKGSGINWRKLLFFLISVNTAEVSMKRVMKGVMKGVRVGNSLVLCLTPDWRSQGWFSHATSALSFALNRRKRILTPELLTPPKNDFAERTASSWYSHFCYSASLNWPSDVWGLQYIVRALTAIKLPTHCTYIQGLVLDL